MGKAKFTSWSLWVFKVYYLYIFNDFSLSYRLINFYRNKLNFIKIILFINYIEKSLHQDHRSLPLVSRLH